MNRLGIRPAIRFPRPQLAVIGFIVCTVIGCGRNPGNNPTTSPQAALPAAIVPYIVTPSQVGMLLLAGGTFSMGSGQGLPDESPRHKVTVSPFAIDRYEVTQDQYAALQLPNPAHFKGDRRPVEQVRWSDAIQFCNERSRHDGLEPCYNDETFACNFEANGYRLPTEAEWEYAARAGDDGEFPAQSTAPELMRQACYAATSGEKTSLAGQHQANAWGIHDLLGNVAEWCHDAYAADYYTNSPADNPRGPDTGEKRVLRGGSWASSADQCRPVARAADDSGLSDACFARNTYGFRCVRRLTTDELERISPQHP